MNLPSSLSNLAPSWEQVHTFAAFDGYYSIYWASLVAQKVKNLPAMQDLWVQALCWEDPQEKGMVTHSSILAWKIPWTEKPGGLKSTGSQKVRHD